MKNCQKIADSGGCETAHPNLSWNDIEFPGGWAGWLTCAAVVCALVFFAVHQYKIGAVLGETAHERRTVMYTVEEHKTDRSLVRLLLRDGVLVAVFVEDRAYTVD